MARYGVALAAARRDLVNRLNDELMRNAGPFPAAHLALIGVIDRWLTEMPAVVPTNRKLPESAGVAKRVAVPTLTV